MHMIGHDDKLITFNLFAKGSAFKPLFFRDLPGCIQDHATIDNRPKNGFVIMCVTGDEITPI
jgi:hypothetical protein